tara:strand:- start:2547 stop:2966 length:420 start_codon:yes stop_codon:yes gene_type:complete
MDNAKTITPTDVPDQDDLAGKRVFGLAPCARLRSHGHLSNLFTHLSEGLFDRIQSAFEFLFSPTLSEREPGGLAADIVNLACHFDGTSAKIFRSWVVDQLERDLPGGANSILVSWAGKGRPGAMPSPGWPVHRLHRCGG